MQGNLPPDSSTGNPERDPDSSTGNQDSIPDSSTGKEQDAGSLPAVDSSAATANAQDDGSAKKEDSLLSVVRNVSEEAAKASAQAQDGKPGDATAQQAAVPTGAADGQAGQQPAQGQEETFDDLTDIPVKTRARFQTLVSQRNTARQEADTLRPEAQQYRQIQEFMDRTQLSPAEVAEGLMLMAEMKNGDPGKALSALRSRVQMLELASGEKLPPEIEERVEQGYVDRETAQQLYRAQLADRRQAITAQQQLERHSQEQALQTAKQVQGAVSAWEAQTRANDPDYAVKAELVRDRLRAHMAANAAPTNADQAVALAREAYEAVSQHLAKVRGPKAPMRSPVGSQVNGNTAPAPRTLLEAIQRSARA